MTMIPNYSPWIAQLNRTRPVTPLDRDTETDVVIVGGGIAGVTTAFFTLRDTEKKVVLIEADKIAHGATGYNAGQFTSYFERPLSELVDEFGLELAIEGQRSIESAWQLIDEIVADAKLVTPMYRFTGHAGLSNFDQVQQQLRDNWCRVEGGLGAEDVLIAAEWTERERLPEEYESLYTIVPQKNILELLETQNTEYVASIANQQGCANSALFTEEVLQYLVITYPDRFSFYEASPVRTVELGTDSSIVQTDDNRVVAERVVLCTNGFEGFTIVNTAGRAVDPTFHHMVAGRIGYMSGYTEPRHRPPTALRYMPTARDSGDPTGETYYYLTRRPQAHESGATHNLVCTGGPEKVLPNGAMYSRTHECDEHVREQIDDFLRSNYDKSPQNETTYAFCWHGLMGYTPNGVRRIGPEPINPALLYNLGCNGVGILPSIFGARRIARFIKGEAVEKSIFDPGMDSSAE
jgi:glycine/D-amino acid oxidase-like deaminating enzyme